MRFGVIWNMGPARILGNYERLTNPCRLVLLRDSSLVELGLTNQGRWSLANASDEDQGR